jgi:hypothetical protein
VRPLLSTFSQTETSEDKPIGKLVNKNLLHQTSKANFELDETYCGGSKHNPSLIYIVV